MTQDPTTWSLAFHGPVSGVALLFAVKLGGESKFASDYLKDLSELRGKLLRSICSSLVELLRPVLTHLIELDVSRIIVPDETASGHKPISEERLQNALRDFVHSDVKGMKDLRRMEHAYACIQFHLKWLRIGVWLITVLSGASALLMVAGKGELVLVDASWIHITLFSVVILSMIPCAWFVLRILLCENTADKLKKDYAELP